MRPRRRSRQAGFSLIELLIAATVLAVGTTGILMTQVASRGLLRSAEETQGATLAAQEVLETMALVEPETLVDTWPAGQSVPTTDFGLRDLQVVPQYPGYAAGDSSVVIEVTVSWTTFDGGTRRLTFETLER